MAFAQASQRPIYGAVATLGVSDRITFLRKTYAHLGGALVAFALLTGGLMKFAPAFSWKFSTMFGASAGGMLMLCLLFAVALYGAQRMAQSASSRGIQYAGLGLGIVAESLMLQPLLWILVLKFNHYSMEDIMRIRAGLETPALSGTAAAILTQSIVITLAIFAGLTAVVFVTKKDFSFLRGALMIASFGVFGLIIASLLFGFTLGAAFSGFMILLMAGYILYETSVLMKEYPPTAYIAAALMLFGTIVTLFWYVLRLLMSLRSD